MKPGRVILMIIAVLILIVVFSATYVVNETQQAIVTQFGKPVGDPVTEPGIHLKTPFIQKVYYFDKRFLEWDGYPNQIPTKDKRFIWVDTYARWRIADPLLFFQRVRDEQGGHSRLDDIVDGETRNAVAKHDLIELVRSSNRDLQVTEEAVSEEEKSFLEEISIGRLNITAEVLQNASGKAKDLGIEILDVRFKRINYVREVQEKVYERMISERKRIADKYRSEGQGEASSINGEKERELKRIQSEAFRRAKEIMGDADAKATHIYNEAYNQSQDARDFYRFLKTMETYENTVDADTSLILTTEGDFFKYLKRQR
ncbi:MAG: protease modulator HflC [bacterium]